MKNTKKLLMSIIGLAMLAVSIILFFCGSDDGTGITLAFAALGVAVTGPLETESAAGTNILEPSVSQKISEHYASSLPIIHIMRQMADARMHGDNGIGAYIHKFYGIDDRKVVTTLKTALATATTGYAGQTAELVLNDGDTKSLTIDDVLKVVFPAGTTLTAWQKGYDHSSGTEVEKGELQLIVVGINHGANKITVQTTNGKRVSPVNSLSSTLVPDLPAGTKFIRLGTALSELDARTKAWEDLPLDEFNYVQTFAAQLEATPEMMEHFKVIGGWDWAKLKSRRLRTFLEDQERSILFGMRSYFEDSVDVDKKYTMGGLDYFIGDRNPFPYTNLDKVTYNSMMRQAFSGNSGNNTRTMFMGSGFAERLSNLEEIQKQSGQNTPEVTFGVKFKGFSNVFGQVNTKLHPMFDLTGHADDALIIDFDNVHLVHWNGLQTTDVDLSKTLEKNVRALFMKEKLTIEVQYPETHMWVKKVSA